MEFRTVRYIDFALTWWPLEPETHSGHPNDQRRISMQGILGIAKCSFIDGSSIAAKTERFRSNYALLSKLAHHKILSVAQEHNAMEIVQVADIEKAKARTR